MKQTSTQVRKFFSLSGIVIATAFSMLLSKSSSAHTVVYYTPSCFTQGSTVTVGVKVVAAGAGSYYHWQYRTSPSSAWVWLSNGNNSINSRTFSVTGASQTSAVINYTPDLVISNVGSPAYTTQLDNIELRVIMTNALDPQTNPYPATAAWGGEEYNNAYEAKYIKLLAKAGSDNCYSNCAGNILVANPALVAPPISDYFGGFEVGSGAATNNFSTPGTYGATSRAASDITQWTSGALGTAPRYRVMNNPDSMNTAFTAIAPHSGNQMLVVSRNDNATNRLWYRTIAVANSSNIYNGQVTFKAWFAKVDATNASMVLEVKGATTESGTVSSFSNNSATQTISGNAGNWVQVSLTVTLPLNTYKKLEFSIHSNNSAVSSVAIDDICLMEPAFGALPVVMSPLKSLYADGVTHLTWATEQESNSNYFEIEHSTNGTDFTAVGKVFANGNSSKTIAYKFDDVKTAAGINYYRLRMVDKDGRYDFSNTVSVNVTIKGLFVTGVYPSPFTDKVSISISSESSTQALVKLHDITGRIISQQKAMVNKGVTTVTVENLGNLAKGMYVVEVNCNGTNYTQKLVK
jgi:methionine-rich copper-binding protein CopC